MAYHHYPTYKPSNQTHDDPHGISYQFFSLIIFFSGITAIFIYFKYWSQRRTDINEEAAIADYEEPGNIDDDDNQYPDIHDFFPNYLDRERQPVRRINAVVEAAPPMYERSILQNQEPPSYDSIVNPRAEAEDLVVTQHSSV